MHLANFKNINPETVGKLNQKHIKKVSYIKPSKNQSSKTNMI